MPERKGACNALTSADEMAPPSYRVEEGIQAARVIEAVRGVRQASSFVDTRTRLDLPYDPQFVTERVVFNRGERNEVLDRSVPVGRERVNGKPGRNDILNHERASTYLDQLARFRHCHDKSGVHSLSNARFHHYVFPLTT